MQASPDKTTHSNICLFFIFIHATLGETGPVVCTWTLSGSQTVPRGRRQGKEIKKTDDEQIVSSGR